MSRLPRRRRSLLAALALLGGISTLAGSLPAPAVADPAPVCNGTTCTETFVFTGGPQTWTVPEVTSATFEVLGAQGAGGLAGAGAGLGGEATATIAVTPGETLQINVGGLGSGDGPGGFNGGGNRSPTAAAAAAPPTSDAAPSRWLTGSSSAAAAAAAATASAAPSTAAAAAGAQVGGGGTSSALGGGGGGTQSTGRTGGTAGIGGTTGGGGTQAPAAAAAAPLGGGDGGGGSGFRPHRRGVPDRRALRGRPGHDHLRADRRSRPQQGRLAEPGEVGEETSPSPSPCTTSGRRRRRA